MLTSSPFKETLIAAQQKNTYKWPLKPSNLGEKKATDLSKKSKPTTRKVSENDSDSESSGSYRETDTDSDTENDISDHDDFDQLSYEKNDYVIVEFTKKRHISYYAGKIIAIDEDEVKTTFLNRTDMHKGRISFRWPKKADMCWHDEGDIMLKLPNPNKTGRTSRTSEKFIFSCDLSKHKANLK